MSNGAFIGVSKFNVNDYKQSSPRNNTTSGVYRLDPAEAEKFALPKSGGEGITTKSRHAYMNKLGFIRKIFLLYIYKR